ncbi:hypothetical protein [Solitalea lacus]|uniref:hypothetical protein n=1 Tax=Solitalea lacus TaxID=2911172 RepID=UPI001EDC112F|nr:hypothetical protein [Solitalea lacus]UKJ08113.1 hypothetical protein L2B55_02845 [Solitalea lacus]
MGNYKLMRSFFSNRLEVFAADKTPCSIIYTDESGRQQHTMGLITEFYEINNKEFLRLDNGTTVLIDSIVNVNGVPSIDFDNYC